MTRTLHIVDHDPSFRETLRSTFSTQSDLIIRCYPSGDMFLAQMDEVDPGVLLIECHMPGTSGLDVLNALRNGRGGYAPVVLTAQGEFPCAVATMKAGALDYIEKSCDPARLIEVVETAFVGLERDNAASQRVSRARTKIATLSPRETDVLVGLVRGLSNKAIASELGLSPRTVEIHRANMMTKLDVGSLSEAMRIAYAAGLFALDDDEGGL